MNVIDLFSGLGGFSQAFLDRGHNVVRFDNDPKFAEVPNTVIADIRNLTPEDIGYFNDIILASPPCTCFSMMAVRTHWPNGSPTPQTQQMIELVKYTIDLINECSPRFWVLENPTAMLGKHVLGRPAIRTWWGAWYSERDEHIDMTERPLKPTDLWGRLPDLTWPKKPDDCVKISRDSKDRQRGIQGIKDSSKAAMIPYNFSLALCKTIENGSSTQETLA